MSHQDRVKFIIGAAIVCAGLLIARGSTLRGVIMDPSGAVTPKATVTLSGPARLGYRETVSAPVLRRTLCAEQPRL